MAVIRTNFLSRCLGRQVDINVIIPTYTFRHNEPGVEYPYSQVKKFKTMILLHGFSGDCNDYLTFSNIVRYAEAHDLAVIMPSGFNSGYIDEKGAKNHTFIAEELLEVCGFLFPISTKREDVILGGLSMGAMGAARVALAHPETFSEVFMMSGAPRPQSNTPMMKKWFGDDPRFYYAPMPGNTFDYKETQEDAFYQAANNIRENKPLPIFTMTVGMDDGALESCRNFYSFLTELGYQASLDEILGFGHVWDFWDQELRRYIENRF